LIVRATEHPDPSVSLGYRPIGGTIPKDHSMSMTRLVCAAICALATLAHSARAEEAPAPGEITARLTAYLDARVALGQFRGTALVAKNGEVLLCKGYGNASSVDTDPNGPDTVYPIASLTKAFTSMGIMMLAERGKLQLTDSITKYIEGAPETWDRITIEQVLTHTAGIPDYETALGLGSPTYTDFMSRQGICERAVGATLKQPLRFTPGENFEYSNTGYLLLGLVIERLADKPLDQFFREEIFGPLHMDHTSHAKAGVPIDHLAVGFALKGDLTFERYSAGLDPRTDYETAPSVRLDVPLGDSGIVSTARDLLIWDQALYDTKLLSAEGMARLFTPTQFGYAFGWIVQDTRAGKRISHTGILPGYTSLISRYPDDRLTVILLSNATTWLATLEEELAAIARGQDIAPPVRRVFIALTPEDWTPLLGTYTDNQGRDLVVEHDGQMLVLGLKDTFTAGLLAVSNREFYSPLLRASVRFTADDAGAVTGVAIGLPSGMWEAQRSPAAE